MNEMCLGITTGSVWSIGFAPLCTAVVPDCFTVQPLITLASDEGAGTG